MRLSKTAQLHMTQKAEYNAQPDRQGKGMRKGQVKSQISKGVAGPSPGAGRRSDAVTRGTNSIHIYIEQQEVKITRSHI